MPIIKSARKRVRVAKRAATRNAKTKRNLKDAVKSLHTAIKGGKKAAGNELNKAQSTIDTAVKKNVIHKNKAARKKSQLAKAAKAAGIKPAVGTKKTAAKKAPAKKSATKKAPAKKKK